MRVFRKFNKVLLNWQESNGETGSTSGLTVVDIREMLNFKQMEQQEDMTDAEQSGEGTS
jgi:hypothetical protein